LARWSIQEVLQVLAVPRVLEALLVLGDPLDPVVLRARAHRPVHLIQAALEDLLGPVNQLALEVLPVLEVLLVLLDPLDPLALVRRPHRLVPVVPADLVCPAALEILALPEDLPDLEDQETHHYLHKARRAHSIIDWYPIC